MLVRRAALEEAGGIESIRGALIDDCSLAAQIKHRGGKHHPIRLDLADRSVSLRPCDSWRDIWNMIARTAFTQLRYSPLLLAGTLLGMSIIYLLPPLAALAYGAQAWPAWLAWAAMSAAYAPMLAYYRRSLLWAPALPLVALFYTARPSPRPGATGAARAASGRRACRLRWSAERVRRVRSAAGGTMKNGTRSRDRVPVCFRARRAYCVSSMYIWITVSGEKVTAPSHKP